MRGVHGHVVDRVSFVSEPHSLLCLNEGIRFPLVFDVSSSHASTPPLFSAQPPPSIPTASASHSLTHTHTHTHTHTLGLAVCLRETRHKAASGGEFMAMSRNTSSNDYIWKKLLKANTTLALCRNRMYIFKKKKRN